MLESRLRLSLLRTCSSETLVERGHIPKFFWWSCYTCAVYTLPQPVIRRRQMTNFGASNQERTSGSSKTPHITQMCIAHKLTKEKSHGKANTVVIDANGFDHPHAGRMWRRNPHRNGSDRTHRYHRHHRDRGNSHHRHWRWHRSYGYYCGQHRRK